MEEDFVEKLNEEYYKKYKNPFFLNLKLSGYFRFQFSNGRIVKKTKYSLLYVFLVQAITCLAAFDIINVLYLRETYLLPSEVIIVFQFAFFHVLFLINIHYVNTSVDPHLITHCIKIDVLLGVEETVDLRKIEFTMFKMTHSVISAAGLVTVASLCYTYGSRIVDLQFFITSLIYFFMVYNIYYDLDSFLSYYTFIILRVCYLNKAIIELVRLNVDYVPNLLALKLYWTNKIDDAMARGTTLAPEKLIPAFILIFDQLRVIEANYRFTVFIFLLSIPMGTFVSVGTLTFYIKTRSISIPRVILITGWGISSWLFILLMSIHLENFTHQINQTKLICTYTQLKPTSTVQALKLTKRITRALSVRDTHMSIYEVYNFDTGLVFRIVSSIFVYITVQLQLTLPQAEEYSVADNTTSVFT